MEITVENKELLEREIADLKNKIYPLENKVMKEIQTALDLVDNFELELSTNNNSFYTESENYRVNKIYYSINGKVVVGAETLLFYQSSKGLVLREGDDEFNFSWSSSHSGSKKLYFITKAIILYSKFLENSVRIHEMILGNKDLLEFYEELEDKNNKLSEVKIALSEIVLQGFVIRAMELINLFKGEAFSVNYRAENIRGKLVLLNTISFVRYRKDKNHLVFKNFDGYKEELFVTTPEKFLKLEKIIRGRIEG